MNLIDLTHPLSPEVPTWNGSCGFVLQVKKDYDQLFRVQKIEMHAGVGTHMDAPSHRFEGGNSIADIPLAKLFVAMCVIDVTEKADADYEVSLEDLQEYEATYGRIPPDALVIAYTGWDRFWNDPGRYRNEDEQGQMHFPAVSAQVAEVLVQRKTAGLAIDTLSPDCADQSYPVHRLLLGADQYIIENIANCAQIPPKGAYAIALPLRASSTEAPLRIVGVLPE